MAANATSVTIGPYVQGEMPAPLVYQFLDAQGKPIDLSGCSVTYAYRERYGQPSLAAATLLDAAAGQVSYTWTGSEWATPGHYLTEFNATNGTNDWTSIRIEYDVRSRVDEPYTPPDTSPGSASFGPCSNWPVEWGAFDVSAYAPAVTGFAVSAATHILWALSGRQFGTCSSTIRPCRQECYDGWPSQSYALPWINGGPVASGAWDYSYWFPLECGSCQRGECSCSVVHEIRLPARTNAVTQVMVDGAALPTTSYRLDNNQLLVRTDGYPWPRCNNLNLADTQPGTWSVTSNYGLDVPPLATLAVGELGAEIIKATTGQECGLPSRVTSLVRQGVTVQFPSITDLLAEGRLGLYLSDMFLQTVNPNTLTQRARVYRVDSPVVRRAGT